MTLLYVFAFLAGIATVLSPCVLPALPIILSGSLDKRRYRPLGIIIGLFISFSFFTLALTSLVNAFGISATALRTLAILFIALFGLVMLIPAFSDRFSALTAKAGSIGSNFHASTHVNEKGFWGGFMLGLALGLIWTPCAGPILGAVTSLVATQNISTSAILLLLAYNLGTAIPLLLIAYGGRWALGSIPALAKHSEGIRQFFGALMIIAALALYFNLDTTLGALTARYFPYLQVDQNAIVENNLQALHSAPAPDKNTPEFIGITAWINSKPLELNKLKGKVVLVDFWTYSCINCIRTLPYIKHWDEKYRNDGLVIVGVHTPEFEFEKDENNVKEAVKRFGIQYPVPLDNHYKTWTAFNNHYWPAHYLFDQNGALKQVHFGEGAYLETENVIRKLLGKAPIDKEEIEGIVPSMPTSPETYLGYERAEHYTGILYPNNLHPYSMTKTPAENAVSLNGNWKVEDQSITSESDDSTLTIQFLAAHVYLVIGGESRRPIQVLLDGKPLSEKFMTPDMKTAGNIIIEKTPRKYDIIDLKSDYGKHTLTLIVPKGIQLYAFTFG